LNDALTTIENEAQLDEVVLQHGEEVADRPTGSSFHVFRLIVVLGLIGLIVLVVVLVVGCRRRFVFPVVV
jgi:hypothetical protein